MRVIRFAIIVFISMVIEQSLYGQIVNDTAVVAIDTVTMGDEFKLEPFEISNFSKKALIGDAEAANKLHLYFSLFLYNPVQAENWAHIAAENGDVRGQYNYGVYLLSRDDDKMSQNEVSQRKQRSLFWLKKAAKNNFIDAKQLLEQLDIDNLTGDPNY